MSDTGHTPEPWSVYVRPHDGVVMVLAEGEPLSVCNATDYGGMPAEENARRIVACVNALRGLPTEAIEKGFLTHLLAGCFFAAEVSDGFTDKPGLAAMKELLLSLDSVREAVREQKGLQP